MLANCQRCQFHTPQQHHAIDSGCAINPGHWKLWQFLNHVPSEQLVQMSIDDCADFEELPPYNLDDPCIRRSQDGMWNLMNRIRKGWGETTYIYASLTELLAKESVSITGAYTDTDGEFFTVRTAATAIAHSSVRSSQTNSHSLDRAHDLNCRELAIAAHDLIADQWIAVESSYINQIAFDATAQVLFVQFSSNAIYAYFDVPSALWHDFLSADSKGRFLNAHIRNQLPYLCLG